MMGILHQSRGKGNAAARTLGETMSASRATKQLGDSAVIDQIHDISQRPQFSGLSGELGVASSQFPIQAKLTIGQPNDRYEQEADRVASQVVQQINAPASVQSSQGQSVQRTEAPEEEEIQAKPENTSLQRMEAIAGGEASTDLDDAINSARGRGQPLEEGLKRSMGQAMGADFSVVKVHTDAKSDQLNRSIQARAFTAGQDVFFRHGEYNPGSRGGQALIAHELTHVVQQGGGKTVIQRAGNGARKKKKLRKVGSVKGAGGYRLSLPRQIRVAYGSTKARFVRSLRKQKKIKGKQSGYNYATAKVILHDPKTKKEKRRVYITRSSKDSTRHSEGALIEVIEGLKKKYGVTVEWVYTEREACGPDNQNCRGHNKLGNTETFDANMPIYYSIDWPDSSDDLTVDAKQRRKEGTKLLKRIDTELGLKEDVEDYDEGELTDGETVQEEDKGMETSDDESEDEADILRDGYEKQRKNYKEMTARDERRKRRGKGKK